MGITIPVYPFRIGIPLILERTRIDKYTEVQRVCLRYLTIILWLWSRVEDYGKKNNGGGLFHTQPEAVDGEGVKRVLIDKEEEVREEAHIAFEHF